MLIVVLHYSMPALQKQAVHKQIDPKDEEGAISESSVGGRRWEFYDVMILMCCHFM